MFNPKQELTIQDHKSLQGEDTKVDWELNEYQKEQLEQIDKIANDVPKKIINPDDLISRI